MLIKICTSLRHPWLPFPLPVVGIMLVAGLTAAARHWHGLLGWSCEQLLHLTLIDPVCRERCSSTCSKLVNYHFKEVPRKGYPFEQNASIHTSKEKSDIRLWEGMVTTKAWKKVLSPNSYFAKPVDIGPLYHDKGKRIVNGVSLILLNRRQTLVNAYVHNYAWVLSTVWLNRSDNILVSCLVISSV